MGGFCLVVEFYRWWSVTNGTEKRKKKKYKNKKNCWTFQNFFFSFINCIGLRADAVGILTNNCLLFPHYSYGPVSPHCAHCTAPLSILLSLLRQGVALHCTALHNTAVQYTLLHYIAVHCTALHNTAVQYTLLHYIAVHCTALHNTAVQYTLLPCTALHCTALHNTAVQYTLLHHTALHYSVLLCSPVLHLTTLSCTDLLHCIALHCTVLLHCIALAHWVSIMEGLVGRYPGLTAL